MLTIDDFIRDDVIHVADIPLFAFILIYLLIEIALRHAT